MMSPRKDALPAEAGVGVTLIATHPRIVIDGAPRGLVTSLTISKSTNLARHPFL
jgi:hypothetical protein